MLKILFTALVGWALGIATTLLVSRMRVMVDAVPECLTKLDECASAGERAVRCLGAGQQAFAENLNAQTARSELGTLVTRGFGRDARIATALTLFSIELAACDSESTRAVAGPNDVPGAVERIRDTQQGLRSAIRATRKGRWSKWLGR